ncbi:MAG: phosphatidate cytidylyltransferase [Candidatus Gastranaerophilales bacterium]|nr:phosphatidate cytidylyltransferase [Candidatus Gastranaerophilales bacterium]
MSVKIIRYLSGFIILFAILAAIAVSPLALFLLSIVFIIFSLKEYRDMFSVKDIYIHKCIPEVIGCICAYLFIMNYHIFVTPVLVLGIFLSFFITVIRNKKPYTITTFSTIMGFMFIFCTLYIVKLFYFYSENSFALILIYFAIVLIGDYSASRIGPLFKNKLLSPEISPNKTVAGSIANLFFSCMISLLLIKFFHFSFINAVLFGICTSFFAQIGDLSISLIKRDLGIKHSGNLFFNYGGILDRVDAFIFSAPAAYYCLYIASVLN